MLLWHELPFQRAINPSNSNLAVTAGKFGTHIWDISIAHTLSKKFLIVSKILFSLFLMLREP